MFQVDVPAWLELQSGIKLQRANFPYTNRCLTKATSSQMDPPFSLVDNDAGTRKRSKAGRHGAFLLQILSYPPCSFPAVFVCLCVLECVVFVPLWWQQQHTRTYHHVTFICDVLVGFHTTTLVSPRLQVVHPHNRKSQSIPRSTIKNNISRKRDNNISTFDNTTFDFSLQGNRPRRASPPSVLPTEL